VLGSKFDRDAGCLDWDLPRFSPFSPGKCRDSTSIWPRPLPSTSFRINRSSYHLKLYIHRTHTNTCFTPMQKRKKWQKSIWSLLEYERPWNCRQHCVSWALTCFTTNDFAPRADAGYIGLWGGREGDARLSRQSRRAAPEVHTVWGFTITFATSPALSLARLSWLRFFMVLLSLFRQVPAQHLEIGHDRMLYNLSFMNHPTSRSHTVCAALLTASLNKKHRTYCLQLFAIIPEFFSPKCSILMECCLK
jgi:hypothetical protein